MGFKIPHPFSIIVTKTNKITEKTEKKDKK